MMAAKKRRNDELNGPFIKSEISENGEPVQIVNNRRHSTGKRKSRLTLCFVILCVILLIACALLTTALVMTLRRKHYTRDICLTEHCIQISSTILNSIDNTVDPCTDFYQFACGKWIEDNPIPDDASSISNFENLGRDLEVALKKLLTMEHRSKDGDAIQKARRFYQMCTNETAIRMTWRKVFNTVVENLGGWPALYPPTSPWRPPFNFSLETLYGRLVSNFKVEHLFKIGVQPDDKDSSQYVLVVDQPMLNLYAKDFYVLPEAQEERQAYQSMISEVLQLLGADAKSAETSAAEILSFEKQLANITTSDEKRHDISQLYNKMKLGNLSKSYPNIDWKKFLKSLYSQVSLESTGKPPDFHENKELVVYCSDFLKGLNELMPKNEERVVVNYLMWCWFFKSMLKDLPDPFALTLFKFYRTLQVMQVPKLRWHDCTRYTNMYMPMATSRLYVHTHFDKSAKTQVETMIDMIMEAFHQLLEVEDWLTPETKAVARNKIDAISRKIGYPELINNVEEIDGMYQLYRVTDGNYYDTKFQFNKMYQRKSLERIAEPVDKKRWVSGAAVVNAFYSPNTNEIIFPAGILQPVFYNKHFPWAMNFGGIGVVIGHEITHGFDDKGRLYDKYGNIRQWWDNGTIARFEEKARCIEDQYSSYVLEQVGLRINGKNTKGENIADNGGLKQAYKAYKKWAQENEDDRQLPGLDLTNDQLFFLNYAQIWCGSMNNKEAVRKLKTSVHSPGSIRVRGPLSNSEDFSKAYKCPSGSPMNPPKEKKCKVW